MVDIEVTFTNNSSAPIEEITITGKKLSSQMEIHEFSPIALLEVGESVCASLGVDFNDTTNPAKFDISTKTNKFSTQIDARVGELVRGIIITESSFKSSQGKLTGMNESTAKVTLDEGVCDPSIISSRVNEASNIMVVGSPSVTKDVTVIRFAGQTYSDQVMALVTVRVANSTRETHIVVNCEKMVIGSMLVKEIKTLLMKP
jgi:AP-3 complex subunit beta